jgi:outer membrane protein
LEQLGEQKRQDLAAAAAGVGAAKYAVQQALGQYAPSVTMNLSTYMYRQSFPTESEWNVILTVNVPIFSAGQIEANVRTAWSQLRQAALRPRMIERQILQDVRIAYENVLLAENTLVELRTQVQAAADAYRQAGEAFRAGVATSLEQLIAQDQLLTAQVQLNSQEFNYKAVYLSLLRVSGQLSMQGNKVQAVELATSQPTSLPATQTVARLVRRPADKNDCPLPIPGDPNRSQPIPTDPDRSRPIPADPGRSQ